MAKKTVTLYVDDTSLRLMVAQGRRIKEWAQLLLEPGLIENTVVVNEAEVAAKVKQLFQAQKVGSKDIILGVSGLHCLSRPVILPQLPKVMLEEAVRREAKRVLPAPLEQLYLSWQTIPAPEGKTQVFLAAVPRKTADPLLKALRRAGFKPYFMDLKPLLLARVAREATAVIVDVQKGEFDIVVMADSIPQPIRTIAFRDGALSWQEKLTMIRNELDRTIQFYNSNNPQKPLTPSIPIFASSELSNEPELCRTLSEEIGHPVLSLSSPLEYPDGFDPGCYMVNVGLTLLQSDKEAGPSVANLNILPVPYQPKPISWTRVLAVPSAAVAVGLIALLLLLLQSYTTDIATMRGKVNTSNRLLQQRQAQRNELTASITKLERDISGAEASRDKFAAAVSSLEKQSTVLNRHLEVTVKRIPDTISLGSVSYADSKFTITGCAPGEKELVLYLRNLDSSGNFGEISSANMTVTQGQGVDFSLLGNLEKQNRVAHAIDVAVSNLPTTISLANITYADGKLTMNGRATGENEVLSYLRGLEDRGEFRDSLIARMRRMDDGGMDFSVILRARE